MKLWYYIIVVEKATKYKLIPWEVKIMLKSVNNLLEGKGDKFGNHSMGKGNGVRVFMYFGNVVCKANDCLKKFQIDYCGYKGYQSTTRVINSYIYAFKDMGYEFAGEVVGNKFTV